MGVIGERGISRSGKRDLVSRVAVFRDAHPGTTFSGCSSGYHFFKMPVRVLLFQDFGRREPGDGVGHLATGGSREGC